MKAIVNTAPGKMEFIDWPLPVPGPGQVRIQTAACGICATDLLMIAGWERTTPPAIPGHEWSGVVEATGEGVDPSLIGVHCVAENVWLDGGEVGFEHSGGYAQYFLTEARLIQKLPPDFPLDVAVLVEPLAVSVRAIKRIRLERLDSALIFGDGPIGLILTMLLKHFGVQDISLVGGRTHRLRLAEELGATVTVNYHTVEGNITAAVRTLVPAALNVFEASGSGSAMQASLDLAASGGKVCVVGDYGSNRADFPWNTLLHKELEIIGSNASAEAWETAVQLAVSGAAALEKLVTHHLPAESFEQGLTLTKGRIGEVIKVVLDWR